MFRVFQVYAKYTLTPEIRIPNADGRGVGEVWTRDRGNTP